MLVYTRARRFELLTWLPAAHEYASFAPDRIFLEPSQRVEALNYPDWQSIKNVNPHDVSGLIPVRATVNGAPVIGWLPKYALTENYLRQYSGHVVDLQPQDNQAFYPITFTGVKYGAYSAEHPVNDLASAPNNSGVAPPVTALWKSATLCAHCGKPRGDHKIQETEEASSDCDALRARILQKAGPTQLRAMIGVLHVVDTLYGARYGYVALASPTRLFNSSDSRKIDPPLQAQIDACLEFAEEKGYTFVYRLVTPFQDCSGNIARIAADPQTMTCAAPKLLAKGISDIFRNSLTVQHRDSLRLFLSEKWTRTAAFGGGPDTSAHMDGHTIDSCNKCRGIIPALLCFYNNPYKKSVVGRA